jgi:protein phosphatase
VITRALGTDPDVDVDVFTVAPHEGDVFLLCSDGLTTMLSDDAILRVLAEQRDLNRAAKELVRLANRAGGDDNITVVAFAVTDAREAEQPEIEQTTPMPSIEDEDEDEQTLDESDGVPVVAASATAPPPETRSRLPFVFAGIAVAVIVAVAVVWLLFL